MPSTPDILLRTYPFMAELPEPERHAVADAVTWVDLPAGATVFDERQACRGFPFVVQGAVRVVKATPGGREITLYHVAAGQSCVITSSCLLGHHPYNARGITESPTTIGLLPAAQFERLLALERFRRFVFDVFSERIVALMRLVEDVSFHRLDQRLAALLLERGPQVHATRQRLADDLGVARENVSRALQLFAAAGCVRLQRQCIEVVDAQALARRAQGQAD